MSLWSSTLRKGMWKKMLNINMSFHELIYKASHNRMLHHILSSYQLYIKQGRASTRDDVSSDYLDEILLEHRAIFEAFKNKDAGAGIEAVSRHLDNAKLRGYK